MLIRWFCFPRAIICRKCVAVCDDRICVSIHRFELSETKGYREEQWCTKDKSKYLQQSKRKTGKKIYCNNSYACRVLTSWTAIPRSWTTDAMVKLNWNHWNNDRKGHQVHKIHAVCHPRFWIYNYRMKIKGFIWCFSVLFHKS